MQGEINDVGRLQSIMHTIEVACNSIQMHVNPAAAEATILSLSQSPQPYQACKFILENSQGANARFQAAAAIRDAALREWGILTSEDKGSLISFCLSFVMQHACSPEGYVQAKVSSVAAQLLKRGCWSCIDAIDYILPISAEEQSLFSTICNFRLEFASAQKEAFLLQIKQTISGSHGVDVQFTGINFLESLVSEFSPATSTVMGLPREFHEQCRMSLQLDYLKTFYSWAQEAALGVADRIVKSSSEVPEVKVCTAALRLMLQILNWDFHNNSGDGAKTKIDVFSTEVRHEFDSRRSECIVLQPGPLWQEILLTSGHVNWLLNFYGALRHKFSLEGYWLDCPIAVAARKLIVQFCSLTGNIFPTGSDQMQEHHLVQLLSGIIQWVHPSDVISQAIECGKSESEMLDGCRALLAVATITSPSMFDRLLKSICPVGTIALLSALMSEVMKVLMTYNNSEEETWSWVARDILLDTWIALLAPTESSSGNPLLPSEGISAAASLFALIVESELKAASASAFNDDESNYFLQASIFGMDERLSSYGLIARAAIECSVPLLTDLFSQRIAQLQQIRGISDPTTILEEVYSLLLITGHVLADEGEGEIPLVPEAIQIHFADTKEGDKHPVVVLSSSILRFAEQSLDPDIRSSTFSPRLMEAVIWFLARWSRTYLMTPEGSSSNNGDSVQNQLLHSRKALFNFFGEHGQGKFVLDLVIRVSMTTLVSYPGEKDLQELTCRHLLHGLARRRDISAHLVSLDSWRDLANSFANERTFFSLTTPHQRSLARALVLSASGLRNIDASNQYVRVLMSHVTAYLVELSAKHDLKRVSQLPETIMVVCCLLERLRGAGSASEPRTQKAIYEMGSSVTNPVLTLLEVYKHESAVVYLLLKFVVQWVDGQIIYLEAQETAVLINFVMRLLQMYSSHNIGKISLSLSSALDNEEKTEKYKDLRALIQLLANLCSKDLVDFSTDSVESQGINIAQVVYFGLHIITPLISFELLKFPKLCRDYFSLISHMLEVYPEMVAQLSAEAFAHVLGTLDFGLRHQDSEVVDKCLRSLKALASYHYKETLSGKVGLGSHAGGFKDLKGKFQEGILSHFLPSLLQLLLFEDYSTDLVSVAADALLPLILCEQSLYQRLGNELIEKQTNPALKTRLASALHSLTSSNQLSSTLDRINYQRFRKNLLSFLVEVRGFLRTV